jgi:hypothetical protein
MQVFDLSRYLTRKHSVKFYVVTFEGMHFRNTLFYHMLLS